MDTSANIAAAAIAAALGVNIAAVAAKFGSFAPATAIPFVTAPTVGPKTAPGPGVAAVAKKAPPSRSPAYTGEFSWQTLLGLLEEEEKKKRRERSRRKGIRNR